VGVLTWSTWLCSESHWGGVVGLVPHNPPLGKLGAFFLGFIVATLIDLFVKADAPPTRGSSPAPTSTAPTNDPELLARLLTGESK